MNKARNEIICLPEQLEFIASHHPEHSVKPVDILMWLYDMAQYRDDTIEQERIDKELNKGSAGKEKPQATKEKKHVSEDSEEEDFPEDDEHYSEDEGEYSEDDEKDPIYDHKIRKKIPAETVGKFRLREKRAFEEK